MTVRVGPGHMPISDRAWMLAVWRIADPGTGRARPSGPDQPERAASPHWRRRAHLVYDGDPAGQMIGPP